MRKQAKTNSVGWFGKGRSEDDYSYSNGSYALATSTKESLYQETELLAFRDYCKAALSKHALDNLTLLAKYEEACINEVPNRSADFHKIVDAYTFSAIQGILGGF